MKKTSVAAAFSGLLFASALTAPSVAAQTWPTGAEITGHAVRVERGGVVNTVWFEPGGVARIQSDTGREYPGRWFVDNGTMCLEIASGARECWAYQSMLQANQPITMTSTCGPSTWTALSTAAPPMQPPVEQRAGERG